MTAFEFVDELPKRGARGGGQKPQRVLVDFAAALRENPGQWAKWPKPVSAVNAPSTAARINNGHPGTPSVLSTGEFEACTRDGVCYVRFVGGAA